MSTRRPALILLGGSAVAWNQRFLAAARARDLDVLLLDGPGPQAGALRPYAADVAVAAARDLTGVVDRAADWAGRYDVRGVCVLREEYVEAGGVVADLLGLPSPGLRAARVCRDKHLQRRYLAAWSPDSTLVTPAWRAGCADTWSRFPVVVKPVGRLASSGVRLVTGPEQLRERLRGYGGDEPLLLEERVTGPEYSVESLSAGGAVGYAVITGKRTTEADSEFFVETAHTTPAPDLAGEVAERMLAVHEAVLERLAFDTGMAHAEYRVTPGGRVVLTEIAARPPGDSIMALHWLATGAPLEDAVVGLAVGEAVKHPAPVRFARQVYLPHQPGTLRDLTVDPALGTAPTWFDPAVVRPQVSGCGSAGDPPALRCVVGLKPPGTVLGPVRESGDRAAMVVVDADTPAELDAVEARCRAAITLRVAR
ncbi:ATP-grasp domain-containing protein [Planosporangium sp. 12N6]|uniref:ATP-grasp domain-containing protein n=1 Tax=Planosporangium spinosum TaxID=3402278 RepID=UPI003CF707C9